MGGGDGKERACRRYEKKVDRDNEIDTPRDVANPRSSESGGRKRQALANKRNSKKTKIRM